MGRQNQGTYSTLALRCHTAANICCGVSWSHDEQTVATPSDVSLTRARQRYVVFLRRNQAPSPRLLRASHNGA